MYYLSSKLIRVMKCLRSILIYRIIIEITALIIIHLHITRVTNMDRICTYQDNNMVIYRRQYSNSLIIRSSQHMPILTQIITILTINPIPNTL